MGHQVGRYAVRSVEQEVLIIQYALELFRIPNSNCKEGRFDVQTNIKRRNPVHCNIHKCVLYKIWA